MKKRLVSLGLCAAMLVPAAALLTSCSSGNVPTTPATPPLTLTLNMITDGRTTYEGIAAVQEAVNQITENELNIHVVLELYTKDTYLDAVKKKLSKREESFLAGDKDPVTGNIYSSIGSEDDEKRIEIVPGQYRTVTAYPDTYDNQIDVFMVYGLDMVEEVNLSAATLYDVSGELTDKAALTMKYVSESLLNYGSFDEVQTYIPGNAYYGSYEYLLINKAMFDAAPFALGDIDGLSALGDYLAYIGSQNKDITPLYNVGSLGLVSVEGYDSVVASYIANGTKESVPQLEPSNIMKNAEVRAQMKAILAAGASNGHFAINEKSIDPALLNDPDTKFAAAFIQGTADLPDDKTINENYYVIKTRNPVADQDEVFSSLFAVCKYSSDPARCVELVNLLMTNEKLLNTILYGVENVTYTRDELTKIVERKYTADPGSDSNAIYIMDENMVGNIFLAWQNSEMSEEMLKVSANGWELAKRASTDATISPFARCYFEWSDKLTAYSSTLHDRYDDLWAKMPEFLYRINNTTGELYTSEEFCEYLATWLALQDEVNFMANASYRPKDGDADQSLPFATQYHIWWQAKYSS